MRAHFLHLLRLRDVVVEVVLRAGGIEDIAGVADGGLADGFAVLADGLHGDLHVREVVERIEDAEDVHPAIGGVFDETGDDVVRVVRVADGVRAAEEHLEKNVRDFLPELAEALPRILVEEAHGGIEGGSAPHFQGEHLRGAGGVRACDFQHVVRAHAGGDEGLVGIAEGGVGDEEAFLSRIHWVNFSGPSSLRRFFGCRVLECRVIVRGERRGRAS